MVLEEEEKIVIKPFGESYFEESSALLSFAFQSERSEEQRLEMQKKYSDPRITRFGAFIDGQLAAQVFVIHLQTYINGQLYKMGGISAVATWPQYRRQGLVSKLLRHSLEFMKQEGMTVSYLSPFSESFYRKFGWELLCERKTYEFNHATMPKAKEVAGVFKKVTWDHEHLQLLYTQRAQQFTGMLERDDFWWNERNIRNKLAQHVVYYEDDEPLAYMTYTVKEQVLNVQELIYVEERAYLAFVSFIGQHDSMINKARLTMPANDPLAFVLEQPRIETSIHQYFMSRIVDMASFISQYRFLPSESDDCIKLHVFDKHAKWNDGAIVLDIAASGQAQWRRADEGEEMEPGIQLSISALTAVLFGFRAVTELARYKVVTGDEEQINRLHLRIPQQETYISDFF